MNKRVKEMYRGVKKEYELSGFQPLGSSVGKLVDEKQRQYGDSFTKAAKIIEILYPNGVKVHQLQDMLTTVRVLDKLSRISQRGEEGVDLGGESPWKDVAGYGLLGLMKDERRKKR